MSPSPVKAAATELGLPVTDDIEDLLAIDAELGVVVAYGRIIKPHVLAHLPMVNVHFSLLPRWRGAAPVERALLAGDAVTGVCIMDVEEGLDTGGVYARREVPDRAPHDGRPSCARDLVDVGTELLVDVLSRPLGPPEPQVGEVTYAAKIESVRAGDRLELVGRGHRSLGARRRGLDDVPATPAQGAGQRADRGRRGARHLGADGVVATGDRGLRLETVQPEGKAPMPWAAFANGARPAPLERLGQ